MAEVHVRKFQDGRVVSYSTTHSVVDIFFNESLSNVQRKDQKHMQDKTFVCVHWDGPSETTTSLVTVTQPDWEGEHAIDKELCQSLIYNRKLLHTFLKDIYNNLGAKLTTVRIYPPVFIFIHSQDNLLIENGKTFMSLLRQLVSGCVSANPEIKVKIKVNKHTTDACVSLHHNFNQDENGTGHLRFSDTASSKYLDTQSDLSTEQRFEMLNEEMSKHKDFVEMQFIQQRKQNEKIFAAVERVLEVLQNEKTAHGDGETLTTGTKSHESNVDSATLLGNVINDMANIRTEQLCEGVSTLQSGESSDRQSQKDTCSTFLITEDDKEEQPSHQGERLTSFSRSEAMREVRSQIPERVNVDTAQKSGDSDSTASITSRDEKAEGESTAETQRSFAEENSTTSSGHSLKTVSVVDTGNEVRKTVTVVNTSNFMGSMDTTRRTDSSDKQMPKEIAQSQKEKRDDTGTGRRRTTMLQELRSRSVSFHDFETRIAGAGLGVSSLQSLIQGLCEMHPDQERIWTEVNEKLTNDKERFPKAGNVLDTILCLDTSGSIGKQALTEIKAIVSDFISGIEEIAEMYDIEENIGLVTFGGIPKVLHIPTNDYGSLRDSLETITCGGKSPLLLGSLVALTCLTTGTICNYGGPHVLQRIIFITDGHASVAFDEHAQDIFVSGHEERLQMVSAFGAMGNEFGARDIISFVWIPIGNADRNFLKSIGDLSKGRLIEGNEVRKLCNFQRLRKTALNVLETLKGKEVEIDSTQLEDMISALAQGLTEEEKVEIKTLILYKLCNSDNTDYHATDSFDNINIEIGLPPLGSRVIRGVDWQWGDQDSGGPGTIINHVNGGGSVLVLWDNEHNNQYRYGAEGCFDVLTDDGCPRPFQDGQRPEIGVQVERGPDWLESYGGQDGGPGNYGVIIRIKGRRVKVRWENGNIYEYRFGEEDRYDLIMRDAASCLMEKTSRNSDVVNRQLGESPLTERVESSSDESYVWQRFDESHGWQNYTEAEKEKLTKEFVKKKKSCLVSRNGNSYRVCFGSNIERCLVGGSTTRIRRVKAEQ